MEKPVTSQPAGAKQQHGWIEVIDAIRTLVESGTHKAQIARMLKVDRSTITKWLSGYGGKKVAHDDMANYRRTLGLPELSSPVAVPQAPSQPDQPATTIGRELAEIRHELEAAGIPENEIQGELKAWLRSRRSDEVHETPASYNASLTAEAIANDLTRSQIEALILQLGSTLSDQDTALKPPPPDEDSQDHLKD